MQYWMHIYRQFKKSNFCFQFYREHDFVHKIIFLKLLFNFMP